MSVGLAVLASGAGSNLQAILDRLDAGGAASVRLVVSDRAGAGALDRARAANVPAHHVPVSGRAEAAVADAHLDLLRAHDIEVIALAGYLRLVPRAVVDAYRGRILNIHPALLPAFGGPGMYGRHVHEAVIAAGCTVSGATVHCVDERYDEGRILAQWPVPVLRGDTAEALAARVLRVEHVLYPAVLDAFARALSGARAAPVDGQAPTASPAPADDTLPGTIGADTTDVFRLSAKPDAADMIAITHL